MDTEAERTGQLIGVVGGTACRHIADLVEMYLRQEGFRGLQVPDGELGLAAVWDQRPRLVVLDVGLPGAVDGLEVCRRLRATADVPVLMLTARDGEIDRVRGLERSRGRSGSTCCRSRTTCGRRSPRSAATPAMGGSVQVDPVPDGRRDAHGRRPAAVAGDDP